MGAKTLKKRSTTKQTHKMRSVNRQSSPNPLQTRKQPHTHVKKMTQTNNRKNTPMASRRSIPQKGNAAAAASKKNPKTLQLRGYLDAQKSALRKGAPPTNTTMSLEAILDDKPRKRKKMNHRIMPMVKKVPQNKTKLLMNSGLKHRTLNANESSKSEKSQNATSSSLWSKVKLSDKKCDQGNGNRALSSACTLDDLLGTKRSIPASSSLKRQRLSTKSSTKKAPKRKTESGSLDSNVTSLSASASASASASHTVSYIGRTKASDSSTIGIEDGNVSMLTSRTVLNFQKSNKKSKFLPKRGFSSLKIPSGVPRNPPLETEAFQHKNSTTQTCENSSIRLSSCTSDIDPLTFASPSLENAQAESETVTKPTSSSSASFKMTIQQISNAEEISSKESIIVPLPPTFTEEHNYHKRPATPAPTPTLRGAHSTTNINSELKSTQTINSKPSRNKQQKPINNDNFVRLNMKNTAGACKGARSLKQHNRMKRRRAEWKQRTNRLGVEEYEDGQAQNLSAVSHSSSRGSKGKRMTSIHAAIDPLDDFLDGTFHAASNSKQKGMKGKGTGALQKGDEGVGSDIPLCPRHQRPCKLLTVKKSGGNKGRKFYACSLPRGEQCDFFQWQDDTVESAQRELLNSSSNSGFIARQVAGHVDRLKTLTLPELRIEAKKRGLNHTGKKTSVLARLSVWVRDEVSRAVGDDADREEGVEKMNDVVSDEGVEKTESNEKGGESKSDLVEDIASMSEEDERSEESVDESSCCSSSEDELEFYQDTAGENSTPNECTFEDKDFPETTPKSALHKSLKEIFGHSDFREGQEWAIRRCLSRKKSLLVAPTGQGKSLCYALPAMLMDGVCIVVSPLVSLMEDQLRHLPPSIPAATLSGNLSTKKMATIIDDLLRDRLKILFVSPERLASAAFRRLLRPKYNAETKSYDRQLPKVSILCVDEAHCLSQWGHNFRVSYLRLRGFVSKLDPDSVLALTATAGPPVISDICHTLRIPSSNANDTTTSNMSINESAPEDGTKILSSNRDNIDIAVKFNTSEEQRLNIVLKLLRPQAKESKYCGDDELDLPSSSNQIGETPIKSGILGSGSVIIYVWRQKDAELITEQLKGFDIPGGIVCYHGGMDSNARTKAQGKFMRGKVRICVATVAFGLGINKADVRGVIHLCLPPSPEHHLQEIGRAGRDGNPARAIALVLENEVSHKLSLSYSDRISKAQIEALLLNVKYLVEEHHDAVEKKMESQNPSQVDLALPITPLVQATDCKEESIQTILSILEDVSPFCEKLLDVEGIIPDRAIVTLKKRSLDKIAAHEEVAKCILQCGSNLEEKSRGNSNEENSGHDRFSTYGGTASEKGFTAYSFGVFEFSIVKCANLLGPYAGPRHVYAALRRLQSCGELELNFNNLGRSVHLRLNSEGLKYFKEEGVSRLGSLAEYLCCQFEDQDNRRADKVLGMYRILSAVSNVKGDENTNGAQKSKRLQTFQDLIQKHFETKTEGNFLHDQDNIIGSTTIGDSDPHVRNCISSDVNNILQHPSLKKVASSFPHSMKFGDSGYEDYTSLVITKILHGVESPRSPVLEWYRYPLWGKWRTIHFLSLKQFVESLLH